MDGAAIFRFVCIFLLQSGAESVCFVFIVQTLGCVDRRV
jgi:hypothetical protein